MKSTLWFVIGSVSLVIGIYRAAIGQSAWLQIVSSLMIISAQMYYRYYTPGRSR